MPENKTQPTKTSVAAFLKKVPDAERRADAATIVALMQEVTKSELAMWGTAIIGFGKYHYKYDSGREGDMPLIGLSPRKQNLTLYLMLGFGGFDAELKKLGSHSTGKGCLYITRLADIDLSVLKKMIVKSYGNMKKKAASA